jgi:GH15 family glucan-1,4-alpha-glucosidase
MWSAAVVGTHPVEANQEVWLEVQSDDRNFGPLPAYWLENKGANSFWHVPVPPLAVNARLRYCSGVRNAAGQVAYSPHQEIVVRPNLPDRRASYTVTPVGPEGLVGNRTMTVRVDRRGGTYDVYFPSIGLHSDVRPAVGDQPESRSHFRSIVGGLALGARLDWFSEHLSWESVQHYQGATNLLLTELSWRHGPIRVLVTDFVATGVDFPATAGGSPSTGQYIKRFRIANHSNETQTPLFGLHIHAEVNGGIGEPGLSWRDDVQTLLATNRGHAHANRKLARDSTVEFAIAFAQDQDTICEPTERNEAILLRHVTIPPGQTVTLDLLVSGAFTGWRGDDGTFDHWLRPALAWFRSTDIDKIETETAKAWDDYVEPLPTLEFPRSTYAVSLRRCALAAALHADAKWGAMASGFDRGLHAYCWPREAVWAGGALDRAGHPEIGRGVLEWLARVRTKNRPYTYWCQKYSIDGAPEWETPAVDQTAVILWGLERHYRRTGNAAFMESCLPMIEQAAAVCGGASGHPGLQWDEELCLIRSFGMWDSRFGAFFFSNVCVVAGLRSAARLAKLVNRDDLAMQWQLLADRIWHEGILGDSLEDGRSKGMIDAETGRFLDCRRMSKLRGLWTDEPEMIWDRTADIDVGLLGVAMPFGLLPAADPRVHACADAILRHNIAEGAPNLLTRWSPDPRRSDSRTAPGEAHQHDPSSLATLWVVRYLLRFGRETGDAAAWNRAVSLLDEVLARLCPLGLALRTLNRRVDDLGNRPDAAPGLWGFHAMLIETLIDFAGLDYDASTRALELLPILPPSWPKVGMSGHFPCGAVRYQLSRSLANGAHLLRFDAELNQPVTLQIDITCPGLTTLSHWKARPPGPEPSFDRASGRLRWSLELNAGTTEAEWSWD